MADDVRGKIFSPANGSLFGPGGQIPVFIRLLAARAAEEQPGASQLDALVRRLFFGASAELIFGAKFVARHGRGALAEAFAAFDRDFQLASSPIPKLFLPEFRAARAKLTTAMAESLRAGDFDDCARMPYLQRSYEEVRPALSVLALYTLVYMALSPGALLQTPKNDTPFFSHRCFSRAASPRATAPAQRPW